MVTASMRRCLDIDGFADRFLAQLAERAPELRACIHQNAGGALRPMARRCITTVLLAVAGVVPVDDAQRRFGECDATAGIGMSPELYPRWCDSVVAAAMECDPEADAALEAAWRAVLEAANDRLDLCPRQAPIPLR
jgi:hypothetical protein